MSFSRQIGVRLVCISMASPLDTDKIFCVCLGNSANFKLCIFFILSPWQRTQKVHFAEMLVFSILWNSIGQEYTNHYVRSVLVTACGRRWPIINIIRYRNGGGFRPKYVCMPESPPGVALSPWHNRRFVYSRAFVVHCIVN